MDKIAWAIISLAALFARDVFATQILNGNLVVRDKSEIFLLDNGVAHPLREGFIQLEFRKASFWTFLTGSFELEILQGTKRGVIFLNKSDFKSFSSFRTPPAGGQHFMLEGRGASRQEARGIVVKDQNCKRSGFCFACSPGLDTTGRVTSTCGLKFNSNCSGTQRAEVEIQEEVFEPFVTIRDIRTFKVLGHISGEISSAIKEKVVRTLEACH